ncbi:hypothetical protein Tco_0978733 [Tanacetum coccineum]|uniref:Integrase, catalytic region, zinc finger, CCHC-type, peptidase aspartic, catalytic n=1 Tax=Tanacetum coccineum TaxID=301880 RepID=A0ABQ5ENS2_9ASTR
MRICVLGYPSSPLCKESTTGKVNSLINYKGALCQAKDSEPADAAHEFLFLKHIYTSVASCETAREIGYVLIDQHMMKSSEIALRDRKLSWKGVDKLHCSSDKGTYITADLHSVWQIAQPGNHVVQNAVQNPSVQNVRNQNGVIVVLGIANQNENGNVVAAWAKGNANGNNASSFYNTPRRRDATYLQTQLLIAQKEEIGIQLQDEDFDLMDATADLDEIEETDLLSKMLVLVIYEVSSVEQGGGTVEQHPKTIKETQAAKFIRDFQSLAKEADESLTKHKALEWEIERLLRVVVSQDIMSIVQNNFVIDTSNLQTELEHTLDPLPQKLENENIELEFQVPQKVDKMNDLSNPVTSNSVAHPRKESRKMYTMRKVMPWMFRINPFKNTREEKSIPSNLNKPSVRTNPITVSQPHVITKKVVNSDSHAFSSTGVYITTKTRRSQPRSNTKNEPGSKERLASPKPSKPRMRLRWSPWKFVDIPGKLITSSESNGDNACTPNPQEPTIKQFPNSTFSLGKLSKYVCGASTQFLGIVRFRNDHVAAILGYGDLQWGNILITKVYFVESLGHNLFSVGQFCDSDLEVAFRRNTCFIRNLEGVDLLKRSHTTNLYTINLHDMAFASLMTQANSTKS